MRLENSPGSVVMLCWCEKAICVPSGDHLGLRSALYSFVRQLGAVKGVSPEPSELLMMSTFLCCDVSSRQGRGSSKTILLPSCDTSGCCGSVAMAAAPAPPAKGVSVPSAERFMIVYVPTG